MVYLLKMHIILSGTRPQAAPVKAVIVKDLKRRILFGDLMIEFAGPIAIFPAGTRGIIGLALKQADHRVKQRVQVHGPAIGVTGQISLSIHHTITETGGIVGLHGQFIVAIIIIDEPDALDRIPDRIKLIEDIQQVLGYILVADHFAGDGISLEIDMIQMQIGEIGQ